jgi:hypothetical protein
MKDVDALPEMEIFFYHRQFDLGQLLRCAVICGVTCLFFIQFLSALDCQTIAESHWKTDQIWRLGVNA